MSRRVLYINYDFPPMSGPGVWRGLWFIKHLSGAGMGFTVMCGDRSHWCDRYDDSLVEIIPPEVEVVRLRARFASEIFEAARTGITRLRSRILDRIWSGLEWRLKSLYPDEDFVWMLRACAAGLELTRNQQFHCIVSSGPPHITNVVGLFLARMRGLPWIMDYRDLWTDDPVQLLPHSHKQRLFSWLERKAIQRADAVVVVTPSWRELLRQKYGRVASPNAFHLIRNGHHMEPPTALVEADSRNEGQRVWIHFNGTPQYLSEAPQLFAAVARLQRERGPGPLQLRLSFTGLSPLQRQAVDELGIQHLVEDLGGASFDQSMSYCGGADVLMVIVNDDHPTRSGVIPAKTYEAMALGKPIFAAVPRRSDVRDLLQDYDRATICAVDDELDVLRGLAEILDNEDRRRSHDLGTTRELWERHSRKTRAAELARLIESL